jgi:CHAT domain-containing protein
MRHRLAVPALLILLATGCAVAPTPSTAPSAAPNGLEADGRTVALGALRNYEIARGKGRPGAAAAALESGRATLEGLKDPRLEAAFAVAEITLALDLGRKDEAASRIAALDRAVETDPARGLDEDLMIALSNARGRLAEATNPRQAIDHYASGAEQAEKARRIQSARRLWANAAHAAARSGASAETLNGLVDRADALRSKSEGPRSEADVDVDVELRLARAQLFSLLRPAGQDTASPVRAATLATARAKVEAVLAATPGQQASSARSLAFGLRSALSAIEADHATATADAWLALRVAQAAGDDELEARWHAQLARLARLATRSADDDRAIGHFEAAVEKAAGLRPALARSEAWEEDALFLDRIGEDLYLELVDLLLARAEASVEEERRRIDLRRAQGIVEAWKAAELRNYFQDECVDAYRARIRDPAAVSGTAAVVYPIVLPDRLSLLVSHRDGMRQFVVPVTGDVLDAEVREFRRWIVNRTRTRYRRHAMQLYDWLIEPIEAHLRSLGTETIVFVPGGSLRTIPLAALHDGKRFLIDRYAIATVPGLELTDPRPVDREGLSILMAGISKARHGFPALAGVPAELAAIEEMLGGTLLVDEQFERAAVGEAFDRRRYTMVHFATHAQFGATPADSFLLTWDGPLGMDALGEAISAFRDRETPLDLLVLSACQTAAGDERAALGLAGVAVRAGARSALATLWSVSDRASREIVVAFYEALSEGDRSRAEALRVAQRKLLQDPTLSHPAYWAPFLMISSWL